ncbi:MAG: Tad domain-containing protein [Phycisphaeraceae bacterium]|nr:Tad domain-containing protein [Phycisphaeraceae bacterium]
MKTAPTNPPARRKRLARRSPKSRGAVMVLALLGGFMIVGMIGYVFNTGRHAQLRQQTQSAADATAISGAGYVARSFNTVAMNNVEISRLIAVVQLLDAVPLATEYTLLDVRATLETVEDQLGTGTGDLLGDQTLDEIRDDLIDQERQLVDMDEFFNRGSYDVREMTFYDSEFGRGELWKAMESLDEISTATMEQLDELTQVTAIDAGRRNMVRHGGETLAAVAPFDRGIVWQRYEFDDFRNPVVRGRLPVWVDDEVTNRGPYDTIFGWRSTQRESIEIPNPDYSPNTDRERAGSRWSGGTGRGGSPTITVGSTLTGYTTYGTWRAIGDILRSRVDAPEVLYNSQFVTRVNRMGGNKLNYLWPGSARTWVFLDPQWITNYEQAESIIDAGTPRVAYTQFIRMDYQQQFINGQPTGPETMVDWNILRPRGGWRNVPGATKTRDHVWEDDAAIEWETSRTDANGNEVTDTNRLQYRWIYVWAGINVGPEIIIRDPNNFDSRTDLPAPTDFDHSAMERPVDGALGVPGSPFAFLGLSKQPNNAPMWDQLFNTSAYDGHAGIAQASVFNNHSWDLWTQMWHAQLEPVQEYGQWVDLIESQVDLSTGYEDLSVGELQELAEYLRSLEELAPVLLTH